MSDKWDSQQMEDALIHALRAAFSMVEPDSESRTGGGLGRAPEANALASGLSDLLQNQALFRAEIDSLRQEIQTLKDEKRELELRYGKQVAGLEAEVRALQAERDNWVRALLDEIHGQGERRQPRDDFERLPLVIRNDQGDYLGVADRRSVFCLKEFIHLIEKNAGPGKVVTVRFSAIEGGWSLIILTLDHATRQRHEHVLHLRRTVTPNQNEVVQLTSMAIDGRVVPQPFLLALFRKIKEEMCG